MKELKPLIDIVTVLRFVFFLLFQIDFFTMLENNTPTLSFVDTHTIHTHTQAQIKLIYDIKNVCQYKRFNLTFE